MAVLWSGEELTLPGYKNAFITFKNFKTGQTVTQSFLVSPSGFSEQRSNISQINRTIAGWFIQRGGRNLININISGYVLDAKGVGERLDFISNYIRYAEDVRNDNFELINEWEQILYIEGIEYKGYIQSINFSKNSMQPLLYQYNINFIAYSDKQVFYEETDEFKLTHFLSDDSESKDTMSLTQSMYDLLSGGKVVV
ncbi:MAG: hypothetical protein N2749_00755 [Clostridia bacterium]|nr:hypothetical protein [Clostridia bacterium]